MDYNILKSDRKKFYPVPEEDIEKLETALNITTPFELVNFWKNLGYGFIKSDNCSINRIMDPASIVEFRLRKGDFEFLPDIEIYDEFEEGKLIFFEGDESSYISIGFADGNVGKIYYYDCEIANSLEEFFNRLIEDDMYYVDMFE